MAIPKSRIKNCGNHQISSQKSKIYLSVKMANPKSRIKNSSDHQIGKQSQKSNIYLSTKVSHKK